jgi:hypothetical protein
MPRQTALHQGCATTCGTITDERPALTQMPTASAKPLPRPPDPAILRIACALARQLAREDHARQTGQPIEEPASSLHCRHEDDS